MAKIELRLNPIWLREDTDTRLCFNCQTKIFSKEMIRLWLGMVMNNELHLSPVTKTEIVLCESCFYVINHKKIHRQ